MPPTLDLSKFHLIPSGTEAVTYRSMAANSTTPVATAAIAHALRRATATRYVSQGGMMVPGERVVWHVWVAELGGSITPKPFDQILDGAGVYWLVEMADKQTLGSRWRLSCVRV